jgi:hypothetical protein
LSEQDLYNGIIDFKWTGLSYEYFGFLGITESAFKTERDISIITIKNSTILNILDFSEEQNRCFSNGQNCIY